MDAGMAALAGAVTWVGDGQRGTIRHSAAADRWLSAASGPQASTAAIALARGDGGRWPDGVNPAMKEVETARP